MFLGNVNSCTRLDKIKNEDMIVKLIYINWKEKWKFINRTLWTLKELMMVMKCNEI